MPCSHDIGSPVPKNRDDAPSSKLGAIVLSSSDEKRPSVGFDYSRYEHLLEDSNLNHDEKQEVLHALWSIISNFIQLGFGVHPVQQAMDAKGSFAGPCGKLNSSGDSESPDLVLFKSQTTEEDVHAAT